MPKTLTWLHLSDIHFHPKTEWRDSIARRGLIQYLKTQFAEDASLRPDLVFCTGDIAYGDTGSSPLSQQYEQAWSFFEELLSVCGPDEAPLPSNRLYVVPGNHDVNRNSINSDAQKTLTTLAEESHKNAEKMNGRFNERSLEHEDAFRRLDEYAAFVQHHLPHQHDADKRHRYAVKVEIDGLSVGVAGMNSAWSCAGREDDRAVWLPAEWQFNAAAEAIKDARVRIGLIHHPVDWLTSYDREIAIRRISTDFDFWLHGHDHSAWVVPTSSNVTIAAGAVGAATTDEFGFNIARLEFDKVSASVYLHNHRAGGASWTIAPVESHAPTGIWNFRLPDNLQGELVAPPQKGTERVAGLYGRDSLLEETVQKLAKVPFLLVYGLRGIGKTTLIEELGTRVPLAEKEHVRILAKPEMTTTDVYRELAALLDETAEFPLPPRGDAEAIAAEIARRCPSPRPAWIWIDRAHHLLGARGFHPNIRDLLLGLQAAAGEQWHWVLEMRERPPERPLVEDAAECEVPGLDKNSLRDCLANASPIENHPDWQYGGKQLTAIYQWLGGGHGSHAHTQATQLLIEVARGRNQTPMDVYERHRGQFEQRVEEVLLDDLYKNVLDKNERRLLHSLALYRGGIPHDHIDLLESALEVPSAWDGLTRRCLLAAGSGHHEYYLHRLIGSWICTRQLGYVEEDDEPYSTDTSAPTGRHARDLHSAIASCWLRQVGTTRRPTVVNVKRALEAFHHLTAAGDAERIQSIAVELLRGDLEWARKRMAAFSKHLYKIRAPAAQQRDALEYQAVLDPDDHMVQRFLGETIQKMDGKGSAEALECFQKACALRRDFPPYWANLGVCMHARGPEAATEYLELLTDLEKELPAAINSHVRAVQAECLALVGDSDSASALRMAKIEAGSQNPAFYADEAKALLDKGEHSGALKILDLADEHGCTNDFTEAIRASVLQKINPEAASVLRMAKIDDGNQSSAYYADEAKALLDKGDHSGALKILDLADERGCSTDFTEAIRASVLQQVDPVAASALRMAKIDAGSHSPTFYNDEAKALLDKGDHNGALKMLALAKERGCTDEVTAIVRRRALHGTDLDAGADP